MTINELNDFMGELGLQGRKAVEDYICAMQHLSTDVMRNRDYTTAERKEKVLIDTVADFCTSKSVKVDELIEACDNEANRRNYIRKRMEKKGSAA